MPRTCAHAIVDTAGRAAPWLTLVHGATQNRTLFDAQIAHFAPRYRLLLVDLAGHGESAHVPGPFGPAEYSEGALGALDAAGVGRTHWWGTHTGSAVALVLASRTPQRFASLVLEGPVIPGRAVASIAACYGRARDTMRARGLDAAREEWFARSPWFEQMRREPGRCRAAEQRALLDAFQGAPWRDDGEPEPVSLDAAALAAIDVPVLLYNGEHDVPDFLPMADELEAALPRARRETIPATGGFPLWEDPATVNARVAAFLAAVDAGSA